MASFRLRTGQKIGGVSDTHGLLRSEVEETLKGVQVILHAGDVGHVDVWGIGRTGKRWLLWLEKRGIEVRF